MLLIFHPGMELPWLGPVDMLQVSGPEEFGVQTGTIPRKLVQTMSYSNSGLPSIAEDQLQVCIP